MLSSKGRLKKKRIKSKESFDSKESKIKYYAPIVLSIILNETRPAAHIHKKHWQTGTVFSIYNNARCWKLKWKLNKLLEPFKIVFIEVSSFGISNIQFRTRKVITNSSRKSEKNIRRKKTNMHLQSGFMEYSIIWMKRKQSIHQCHPFSNEEDNSPYMISTQATNPMNRSAGPYFCNLGPGPVMSWFYLVIKQ